MTYLIIANNAQKRYQALHIFAGNDRIFAN